MIQFSPSALSTFEACPRKWAWDKIEHVPRESGPYAEFGTEVHRQIEHYYRSGVMLDLTSPEGQCALALLSHLPTPHPRLLIEHHWTKGRFHGYADLVDTTPGAVVVYDHKTTSDHKWAKLNLAGDIQAALYADAFGSVVTAHWNYVTRRRPRVLPVVQVLTTQDIQPTLDRANRLADEMTLVLDSGARALDIPPNPLSCEMYGGCPHKARCNLTSEQHYKAVMTQGFEADKNAFLADVAKRVGGGTPPPSRFTQMSEDGRFGWDGKQWVDTGAAPPPPPPPPVAAAPPPPPPPPAINPPPQPPQAYAPAPPVAAPPPPPPPASAAPEPEATPHEALAQAFEDAADAIRRLGGAPKKGPGRPRKNPL